MKTWTRSRWGKDGQRHALATLPSMIKTRCPLYRRLDGPQGRFGRLWKISPKPGIDPRTARPIASRYSLPTATFGSIRVPYTVTNQDVPSVTTSYDTIQHDSDFLRVGRSGDRIPVGTIFSAPVQTGSEAHTASCTMGTGSFRG